MKNPDYTNYGRPFDNKGPVNVDGLIVKTVPEAQTRLAGLTTGEIHIAEPPFDDIPAITRKPDGEILAMDQIEAVHARLPDTHLVMHGSSSVPQYLQDLINENGGEMPQTWGVPVEEIERGIRSGVRKVNIDTDCRMAMSGAMRKYAREHPEVFDPRKFTLAAMGELETLVRDRFERFFARHQASGRDPNEARAKIARTDLPNAERIRAAKSAAEFVINDARCL